MRTKWLLIIADLFRPEHSLWFSSEKDAPVTKRPLNLPPGPAPVKALSPIKALFWTAASIAIGLVLGQLQ